MIVCCSILHKVINLKHVKYISDQAPEIMSCGSGPSTGGGWGGPAEIINLNVGGTKFSTSKQTLIAIPVRFFNY